MENLARFIFESIQLDQVAGLIPKSQIISRSVIETANILWAGQDLSYISNRGGVYAKSIGRSEERRVCVKQKQSTSVPSQYSADHLLYTAKISINLRPIR